MTIWAMAAVGWLRGEVDPIAVRLPSVIAIVLTTLLIYVYARMCLSRFAAWTAALAYASMAQVVQIGRMGESEALFTLLVSASLLLWHLGYLRQWRPSGDLVARLRICSAGGTCERASGTRLFCSDRRYLLDHPARLALLPHLASGGRIAVLLHDCARLADSVLSSDGLEDLRCHLDRPHSRPSLSARPGRST